jgi:hypothetical protein
LVRDVCGLFGVGLGFISGWFVVCLSVIEGLFKVGLWFL